MLLLVAANDLFFVKGLMVIMVHNEVRSFFVGIIETYGRMTFMVMAVLLMTLFCCCAYYFFIKPLRDDIVVYQSTVARVALLKKKFEPLLQDTTSLGGKTSMQDSGASKADIAAIIDRALDHGLVIESSVRRPQNKSENTIISLRGSFENFMRFLEGISSAFAHVSIQENQVGIFAQLTVLGSISDSGLKERV